MSNAPERFLAWRFEDTVSEDDVRITYAPDSKKTNTGTFIFMKEDHTIGNLLRCQLLRDPSVRYAAYRMPHPLVNDCHVRVETIDSRYSPINAVESALADLQLEAAMLERSFDEACSEYERNQGF